MRLNKFEICVRICVVFIYRDIICCICFGVMNLVLCICICWGWMYEIFFFFFNVYYCIYYCLIFMGFLIFCVIDVNLIKLIFYGKSF